MRRRNPTWSSALAVVLGAIVRPTMPAQAEPDRLQNGLIIRSVAVPGTAEVSIVLAIPTGWQHDPAGRTGCAEAMRWVLTLAQRDQDPAGRFGVIVRPRLTLLWHSGPKAAAGERLAFVETVLSGGLQLTDDLRDLAVGRARLLADDNAWLYPGTIIEQKAWRDLLRGSPAGRQSRGIPAEIARLTVGELRVRLADHYSPSGACLVVVGELPAMKELRRRLGGLPSGRGAPQPVTHDTGPPVRQVAIHERVDGPYVTAAWPALPPTHADFLPFVLAMLAVRAGPRDRPAGPDGCSLFQLIESHDGPMDLSIMSCIRTNSAGFYPMSA